MVNEIAAGLERHPNDAGTLYDLACAEALAGRLDDALEHLRRALELRPEWADHAREDGDLVSLHDLPGWPT